MSDFRGDFKIEVDAKGIASQFGELKTEVERAINAAMGALAASTHAKAIELAGEKLTTTRDVFTNALSFEQLSQNMWVVSLDMSKAGWIEDGRKCVIYGKNRLDQPKVLTPDGHVKITDVKIGMMVLNQFGKWTTVEEIYNEHIVEKSKMVFTKMENKQYNAECPVCHHRVTYPKFKQSYINKGIFCQKCLSKEKIVTIETPSKFTDRKTKNRNKLILTGDHKVMTQRGWVEAWDLENTDSLTIPSWSNCKTCKKPTYVGTSFCYCKSGSVCSSSFHSRETLRKGTHQSQQPESRAKYLKILKNLQKTNNTEELFEKKAIESGYRVGVYSKDMDINSYDLIREYPIKVPSDGKYSFKYYFIDFFSPKLNIGFEIDGKAFHSEIKDVTRDRFIKNVSKCDIVRIPAKNVWKKDFFNTNIDPILKNHSNQIQFLPLCNFKIKKTYIKPNSSVCYRWDITVKDGESFVINGALVHNSGFQEELLRGKSARTGKDGSKYAIIPFEHSKGPSKQTPSAQRFTQEIRKFLKEKEINYKKIEYNENGSPKLGLLHTFKDGLGEAKALYPSANAKNDVFKGLSIYQSKDKTTGKVRRDVMTFRIISEKQRGEGLWVNPGRAGVFIIDAAYEWALKELDTVVMPQILESFK